MQPTSLQLRDTTVLSRHASLVRWLLERRVVPDPFAHSQWLYRAEGWAGKTTKSDQVLLEGSARILRMPVLMYSSGDSTSQRGTEYDMIMDAAGRSAEIMKCLVDTGADMSVKNSLGRTVLHTAAKWLELESVEYLIGRDMSKHMKDSKGATPFDLALEQTPLHSDQRRRKTSILNILRTTDELELYSSLELIQLNTAQQLNQAIDIPSFEVATDVVDVVSAHGLAQHMGAERTGKSGPRSGNSKSSWAFSETYSVRSWALSETYSVDEHRSHASPSFIIPYDSQQQYEQDRKRGTWEDGFEQDAEVITRKVSCLNITLGTGKMRSLTSKDTFSEDLPMVPNKGP